MLVRTIARGVLLAIIIIIGRNFFRDTTCSKYRYEDDEQ